MTQQGEGLGLKKDYSRHYGGEMGRLSAVNPGPLGVSQHDIGPGWAKGNPGEGRSGGGGKTTDPGGQGTK